MEAELKTTSSGLFLIVGVVLVILKLVGAITWPWWAVTLPLWGGLALIALILGIILGFVAVCQLADKASIWFKRGIRARH